MRMVKCERGMWLGVWVIFTACSTSNHLRKFEEGDLSKEVPVELAKRFEVKDAESQNSNQSSASNPNEAPAAAVKQTKKKKVKKPDMKAEAPVNVAPVSRRVEVMPFEVGEKLSYDVRYLGVTAATFQTEVLAPKFLDDRKVYPIQALAKTISLFELVYRADDHVLSYFDFEGLYSHRFTMDLNETKQSRKLIELYDYEKNKSFFWNRIDHVQKGYKEEKLSYDIQPWSQDPLSALFFLRVAALPTDPKTEFRMPVIMDGKPWESVIHYLRTETIYAGGKTREARVYHMDNFTGGELKNKDNTIWISTDSKHYLLRVETKVKVGSFAVALDKIL